MSLWTFPTGPFGTAPLFDLSIPHSRTLVTCELFALWFLSPPLTEVEQWSVHTPPPPRLLYVPGISSLFFHFLFPPAFVVSAPVWPLCNTVPLLKKGGKLCVSVRVCQSSRSLKRKSFDHFTVCVSTLRLLTHLVVCASIRRCGTFSQLNDANLVINVNIIVRWLKKQNLIAVTLVPRDLILFLS